MITSEERARTIIRNLLSLIDTDPVWRASAFAKDAREYLDEDPS